MTTTFCSTDLLSSLISWKVFQKMPQNTETRKKLLKSSTSYDIMNILIHKPQHIVQTHAYSYVLLDLEIFQI